MSSFDFVFFALLKSLCFLFPNRRNFCVYQGKLYLVDVNRWGIYLSRASEMMFLKAFQFLLIFCHNTVEFCPLLYFLEKTAKIDISPLSQKMLLTLLKTEKNIQ